MLLFVEYPKVPFGSHQVLFLHSSCIILFFSFRCFVDDTNVLTTEAH